MSSSCIRFVGGILAVTAVTATCNYALIRTMPNVHDYEISEIINSDYPLSEQEKKHIRSEHISNHFKIMMFMSCK